MRSPTLSSSSPSPPPSPPPLPLRILTFNIRYATTHPFPGELPWPLRLPGIVAQLQYHTRHVPTAVVCLQEALHGQLIDLLRGMNQGCQGGEAEWAYVGVGRNDGKQAGEYSAIFFRSREWLVEHWSTKWLSPTPDVPGSKGWDAASVRVVTVAVLQHRGATGGARRVGMLCTHLDDQGSVSRRKGAEMLGEIVRGMVGRKGLQGVVLAGDLNSEVSGEAWEVLNRRGSGCKDLRRWFEGSDGRVDRKKEGRVYGEEDTFTGFDGKGDDESDPRTKRFDFIHLSTADGREDGERLWKVEGYAVLPNRFGDGINISDHRAIVGDIVLK